MPWLLRSIATSISPPRALSVLGALQQFAATNVISTSSSRAPTTPIRITCDGEQLEWLTSFTHGDTSCRCPFPKPDRSLKRHEMPPYKRLGKAEMEIEAVIYITPRVTPVREGQGVNETFSGQIARPKRSALWRPSAQQPLVPTENPLPAQFMDNGVKWSRDTISTG